MRIDVDVHSASTGIVGRRISIVVSDLTDIAELLVECCVVSFSFSPLSDGFSASARSSNGRSRLLARNHPAQEEVVGCESIACVTGKRIGMAAGRDRKTTLFRLRPRSVLSLLLFLLLS